MNRKVLSGYCFRYCSSSQHPKLSEIKTDMVGPPDPVSNLRPIIFYVPENETELERKFRLERENVQQWNQEFWVRHNISFYKERQEYISSKATPEKKTLDANEMSVFYKDFLDRNWKTHVNYNWNWYKKNINLVVFAFRVKMERIVTKAKTSLVKS